MVTGRNIFTSDDITTVIHFVSTIVFSLLSCFCAFGTFLIFSICVLYLLYQVNINNHTQISKQ